MKWSKSWRHFCGNHRRIYVLCFGLLIVLLAGCRSSSTGDTNDPTAAPPESDSSRAGQLPPPGECIGTNNFDGLGLIYDDPVLFDFIGELPYGQTAIVVGQMAREDGELFYQISLENAELEEGVTAEYGWVYAEVPTISEPCSNIPEIAP